MLLTGADENSVASLERGQVYALENKLFIGLPCFEFGGFGVVTWHRSGKKLAIMAFPATELGISEQTARSYNAAALGLAVHNHACHGGLDLLLHCEVEAG